MDVSDMLAELNDHGFEDTDEQRKIAVLQDTIWQVEGIKPWPFLRASWTLTFDGTSGEPSNWATLSPSFRASVRVKDLSNGRRIMPLREEEFEDRVGKNITQAGPPLIYYFGDAAALTVWPVPPSGSTLQLRGTRWSDLITSASAESAILIPKYFHRGLIVNGALQRLYAMEDDTELAPVFQNYQSEAMDMATEALFNLQYDRADHVRVTDPDSWDFGELFPILNL